jgi:nicotinamide riboside kinase
MINGFNSSAGSVMTVVPEYARGYLREYGDSNLSEQTWNDLFRSGIAQLRTNIDSAIIVRDTSLITTVGWATILNPDYMAVTTSDRIEQLSMVDQTIRNTRNDLYFLLPDDVPFEVDPQRYGIYKRQSTKEFWKTLLDKYGISPIVVPDENSSRPGPKYGSLYKKTNFMIYHILKKFESNLKTT